MVNNAAIRQAREALWRASNLSWMLDSNQKVCYNIYKTSKDKINVWNLARGSGKSFLLCVIAIEECLRNPKALVKYVCARQKDATGIIRPLFRDILDNCCPDDLRPEWIKGEGAYRFPNGARLELGGVDSGKSDSLRGGSAVLAIVDEAGDRRLNDLEYIVRSILIPCVTRTKDINGKIILASTPPVSPEHPFVTFLRQAEYKGTLVTRNVYTNPRMTQQMLEDLITNCGGEDSETFRREYLCQVIRGSSNSVIPEFTLSKQERIVKEWKRPPFFDGYVSMDIGFNDLTVVLFAYYDFKENKLVFEDEFVINGEKMTTSVLADGIRSKERSLFSDKFTGEFREPYKRVSDNNLIVIQDLYKLHNLIFQPTKKDDKNAAINNFRMLIEEERVVINPRCVTLIRHLGEAHWDNSKKKFAHSKIDGSHYDACDAACYLVRNVDFFRNPYPKNYGMQFGDSRFDRGYQNYQETRYSDTMRTMLNLKKKK